MSPKFLAPLMLAWLSAHPAAAQPKAPSSTTPTASTKIESESTLRPSPARAASPAPESNADELNSESRQQARQRFEAGMKLYEEGDYALALLEFERAHSLVPGYRVLYNIGQVNIQLGRYARAVRKLRQYLAEGADQIPADRRGSVLSDLDMLAGRTASILVSVNVPDAEIVLDNDVIATSPMPAPMLIDAGEHRLTIRKPGYLDQLRPIALAGRDQQQLDVVLTEAPKSVPVERTVIVDRAGSPEVSAASSRRQLALTLGWTGTGLLATAWATTGYMGLSTARQRQDKLHGVSSSEELTDLKQRARNWYIASDICGGMTLAAAATMVYYTFFAPRPKAPSNVIVAFSPGSILVAGHF